MQKGYERMKRLTEEGVLTADLRHHRAQLGEDKCAGQCDQSARRPYRQDQKRRLDRLRDDVRVDEDARSDDAADDDHRRVEEVELASEFHRCPSTSSISSCTLPLVQSRLGVLLSKGEPSSLVTRPPASSTMIHPAAVSHAFKPLSQN